MKKVLVKLHEFLAERSNLRMMFCKLGVKTWATADLDGNSSIHAVILGKTFHYKI